MNWVFRNIFKSYLVFILSGINNSKLSYKTGIIYGLYFKLDSKFQIKLQYIHSWFIPKTLNP